MRMKNIARSTYLWLMLVFLFMPAAVSADDQPPAKQFTQQQLDQMLSPIALYPDSLLTQILIASTYPIEVVDADRWLQQNKKLKGDKLQAALNQQTWDASIKALAAFPNVLDMMNNKLDWTQNVGDAFLAQQKDVMDTVQQLRKKAMAAGTLASNQQQEVKSDGDVIIVQPANPQVVYVPVYDPTVVYGPWMYPGYPPYPLYPPPPPGGAMFAFSMGVMVGAAWGPTPNWHGGTVIVNNQTNYNHYGPNNPRPGPGPNQQWHPGAGPQPQNNSGLLQQHDPDHRQGVPYSDQSTRDKYSPTDSSAADSRSDYRGYDKSGSDEGGRGSAFDGMDRGDDSQRSSDRGFQSMRSSGFGGGRMGGGGSGRFR